ncbi:hypothetical protein G9A89_019551 [Geosiphon pyriformis]|nr:hypothetical protein G9A89_019551 [Geosiphon pyriformis]
MLHIEDDLQTSLIKELETQERELQWLLNSQLPNAILELKRGLRKCEALINSQEHEFIGTTTLAVSSNNNDTLKGFVTLNRSAILKGELQLKLPNYNRGNLLKVQINALKPYFVEQLVDAQNYFTMALDALDSLNEPYSKQSITEILESALKYITNSRNVLSSANEDRNFPYKICDPQMFNPPLADDFIIEFFVEGAEIVTSVYALQYQIPATPTPKLVQLGGILSSKQPAKVCKYKDKQAIILDQISVRSLDPRLEEIVEGLRKTERECLAWRAKLSLF